MAADAVESSLTGHVAGGFISDAFGAGAINADAGVHLVVIQPFEHTAEGADALFFHSAHEHQITLGLDTGGVQGPDHRQRHYHATGVIHDARSINPSAFLAGLGIGTDGENGVHMSFHQHFFAAALAGAQTFHIAVAVNMYILKAQFFIHLSITGRLLFLMESRSFDFAQFNLIFQGLVGILLGEFQGFLHLGQGQQLVQRFLDVGRYLITHH